MSNCTVKLFVRVGEAQLSGTSVVTNQSGEASFTARFLDTPGPVEVVAQADWPETRETVFNLFAAPIGPVYAKSLFGGPETITDRTPALGAALFPSAVTTAPDGRVFIAESSRSIIRSIGSDGILHRVASSGATRLAVSDGRLFWTFGANLITVSEAGLNVAAFSSSGSTLTGIAVAPNGDFYLSDANSNQILRVTRSGVREVIAGTGIRGFSGHDGPALEAELTSPGSIALGSDGTIYFLETGRPSIRKISADGIIRMVAGDGVTCRSSGDNGPAIAARVCNPADIAINESGNLLIVEAAGIVRNVSPDGLINRAAGGGANTSVDNIPATSARLSNLSGVAALPDNEGFLIVQNDNIVYRVDREGVIRVFAGTMNHAADAQTPLEATFRRPEAISTDFNGNIYVADTANHRIRRIDPNGVVSTIAGTGTLGFSGDGGLAVRANLSSPRGIAVDKDGEIWFCDSSNNRIRKITAAGIISTVVGSTLGFSGDGGPASAAQLRNPFAITFDAAGNLLIADTNNHRIRKVSPDGRIETIAGTGEVAHRGESIPATEAGIQFPRSLVVDANDNIYVGALGVVRRVSPHGVIDTYAGNLSRNGYAGDGGRARDAQLGPVSGLLFDKFGNLLTAELTNGRVRSIGKDTGVIISLVKGMERPAGLALTPDGTVLVVDSYSSNITALQPPDVLPLASPVLSNQAATEAPARSRFLLR